MFLGELILAIHVSGAGDAKDFAYLDFVRQVVVQALFAHHVSLPARELVDVGLREVALRDAFIANLAYGARPRIVQIFIHASFSCF